MKVYISGQISNRDINEAKEHFSNAERDLLNWKYEPISPFDNGLSESDSWEEHMKKDIEMLSECEAIYMLVGWEKSKGAIIEKAIAENFGKKVWFEPKFVHLAY